jgi:hypothetical protein
MTLPDLYDELKKIEERGMIEYLYDIDPKKKTVIYKFCCPFLKETLYQRMLIEQRNDIHMQIARLIQKNHVSYLPNLKLEKLNLRKQLENGQKSIIKEMEAPVNVDSNENKEVLNVNSLKILIVKEICDKLRYMRNYSDDEIEQIEGKEKLAQALKYGMVEKKSDGKITWENRFFVITSKHVSYYYHLDEYIGDKVPLATFELKDIYELKQLSDSYYGNKKNIFKVSVSSWKKKEQIKGKRSYIFSCATLEDLYSWIISINFLKANAYYNIFTSHFGKIGLPLYKFKTKKPKKFFFNLEDKQYLYNIDNKSAVSTKEIATANSQIKKVNNVNVPIEKAITPELRKNVANLISNVFLCILGDIQYRLAKYHNDIDKDENEIKEIAVPPHLKSCSDLRNPEEEDDFNKSEEEEEEKSEKKEELIEKENENNSIKSKEEENSENKNDKITSDEKKEIIISEKNSEKEKILDKEEKLKNEKIEITDIIDISKNNDKNMIDGDNDENNNENEDENYNNNDDDFDDMDFDMNEEEEDTHIPKFFVKDKSIIQLNEYLIQ